MTGATHLLAGAAVYSVARTRTKLDGTTRAAPLALALAFTSHFLLDAALHFELSLPWQYALAAAAGLFIFQVARQAGDKYLLLGGIAGALPDAICASGASQAFIRLHAFFHFKPVFHVPFQMLCLEFAIALLLACLLARNELASPLPTPERKHY